MDLLYFLRSSNRKQNKTRLSPTAVTAYALFTASLQFSVGMSGAIINMYVESYGVNIGMQ